MNIYIILDTHFIGTLHLSALSQANSLRQHNLGHRPQTGIQPRVHRPVIVTHSYTSYYERTPLAS